MHHLDRARRLRKPKDCIDAIRMQLGKIAFVPILLQLSTVKSLLIRWSTVNLKRSATIRCMIGCYLFVVVNIIFIFFFFIYSPDQSPTVPVLAIKTEITSALETESALELDTLSKPTPKRTPTLPLMPLYVDPVIDGIPHKKLPFMKLETNNHDPHRMETHIPSDMLYKFNWRREHRGLKYPILPFSISIFQSVSVFHFVLRIGIHIHCDAIIQ